MSRISKKFKNKIRRWKFSKTSFETKLSKADVEHLSTHFENKLLGIIERNTRRNKDQRRLIQIKIRKGENNLSSIKSKMKGRGPKKTKHFNSQTELKKSFGSKNIKFSQQPKQVGKTSRPQSKKFNSNSQSKSYKKTKWTWSAPITSKPRNLIQILIRRIGCRSRISRRRRR